MAGLSDSDREPELGPAYYEEHADRFGWGPETGVPSPSRTAFLDEHAIGSVLDVGCGPGFYVDYLAGRGHEAMGLDQSAAFIGHARQTFRGTFVEGDACALPFEDDQFDTGVAFDVLEHVDDARALAELARVTRERVLLAVPAKTPEAVAQAGLVHTHYRDRSHLRYYDEAHLRALVEGAGLEVLATDATDPVDFRALLSAVLTFRRSFVRRRFRRLFRKAEIQPLFSTLFVVAARSGPSALP